MTTHQDLVDPVFEPVNLALMRLLASRLAAAYATMPGKQNEAKRWATVAFQAAAPPQVQRTS